MIIEQKLKVTFEELVILSGLVVGHQLRSMGQVPDNHWNVLMHLHEKLNKALVECADHVVESSKGGSNGAS